MVEGKCWESFVNELKREEVGQHHGLGVLCVLRYWEWLFEYCHLLWLLGCWRWTWLRIRGVWMSKKEFLVEQGRRGRALALWRWVDGAATLFFFSLNVEREGSLL